MAEDIVQVDRSAETRSGSSIHWREEKEKEEESEVGSGTRASLDRRSGQKDREGRVNPDDIRQN